MSIGDRIKTVRGPLSQEEFARRIDASKTAIGAYEKGVSSPGSAVIVAICDLFNVEPRWLLKGEGPMRVTPQGASYVFEHKVEPLQVSGPAPVPDTLVCADCELVMVPMVEARLSAGNGSFEVGEDVERRYAFRTDFLLRKGAPSSMVLMRVDGDSMEPYVLNGDVVLIDQSQREPRPGKVYAVGVEDLVYLKVVNAAPGKLVLTSHNAAYPPLEVDARGDLADGIRIIGRAVWVGRELN